MYCSIDVDMMHTLGFGEGFLRKPRALHGVIAAGKMCLKDEIGPRIQLAGVIEIEKGKNNGVQ